MSSFTRTINGRLHTFRRMTFGEIIALGEIAYDRQHAAIVRDAPHLHDIDKALAELRENKDAPYLTWQYIRSVPGSVEVLQKSDPTLDINELTREQMVEIAGTACGWDVRMRDEGKLVAMLLAARKAGGGDDTLATIIDTWEREQQNGDETRPIAASGSGENSGSTSPSISQA